MEVIEKKPITSELRALEVGDSVVFPIEQRSSVMGVKNKLEKNLVRQGWRVEVKDDLKDYTVTVTRVN